MKAIYKFKPQLCVVVEIEGETVLLEPVDGTEDERFTVSLGDPNLVLDPTDDEVREIEG